MEHIVLFIDDDPMIVKSIQRLLRREPFQLVTAGSAQQGFTLADIYDFSLVISDFSMPGMDGLEFLGKIKAQNPQVLTMMLTGKAEIDLAVKAINDAGVYKFILKPWDENDLKLTIRRALESLEVVKERDDLRSKVDAQAQVMAQLEKSYPGITRIKRDRDGYLID
jgi:DNA-binding NtrC family response regulator